MEQAHRISYYWKCQLIGWSLAAAYWQLDGLFSGAYDPIFGIVQFVTDVAMYIGLTHGYRLSAHRWKWTQLGLNKLVYRIAIAILAMGVLYCVATLAKIYLLRVLFSQTHGQGWNDFWLENFRTVLVGGLRMMGIWLLAYHLYQFAASQIDLARRNATLQVLSRQAQLDNLSAQLNPHFLFNSLNTIKFLVGRDPSLARRGIDLLADLLRAGLYPRESSMTTLSQEISLVKDYLELEAMRFEERLNWELQVDESLLESYLPHFAVQTLVENAIKHGIAKEKQGGTVLIVVDRSAGGMSIRVISPGQLATTNEEGIGLSNLKNRLKLAYAEQAHLEVYDSEDKKDVHCHILIPII
jgi:hypothetical protein